MSRSRISKIELVKINARLPLDLVQALDLFAAKVRCAHGRNSYTRSDALRHLVALALGHRERKAVVSPQRPWRE